MPDTPPTIGMLPQDQLILHGPRVSFVLRPTPTNSGQTRNREVVLHPGAVIILPLLEAGTDPKIVLIKNHRHTLSQTLLELPAGTLEYAPQASSLKPQASPRPGDPTEDPAACAARELTEETGYLADSISPLGWFYTSPGILTEKMYAFLATGLTPGPQSLEDNEQIETVILTKSEILALIRENRIVDAKTIATLLKYFAGI